MRVSRQLKSPKLGIVMQITEVTPGSTDGRRFEVHDVERNRGFRVTLAGRILGVGDGDAGLTEDDIDRAIAIGVERFLVSSPELVAGPLYDVALTSTDLSEARSLRS